MEDIISSMPKDILFIVVSLLPFKEAAKTSILSRKWRLIWLATTNIEFDERHFVKQDEESEENKENQRRDLIRFARRWIRSYEEPIIHKFCLAFSYPANHALDMQHCIRFAVARGVKVLDLDFSVPSWNEMSLEDHHAAFFDLPFYVYTYPAENLESLKLFSCNFLVARFKIFRALKNLSLGWANLTTSVVTALLTKCPVLESLSLKRCWGLDYLDISAPSLTSLVVDKCLDLKRGIRVDARTLRFLKYSGRVISLRIEYLRSIVEAVLDFGLEFEFSDHGELLCDFCVEVGCSRVLTICSYMLQVIPTAEDRLSIEPPLDVEHLTLKTALDAKEYYGITFFLSSCPYLKTLSIDLTAPSRIFEEYSIDLPLDCHDFVMSKPYVVYPCVSSTLKVVEVKGFKGGENELGALRYFIRHGSVLEKMAISVSKEEGPAGVFSLVLQYRQKAMQLLQFRRASLSLAIVIS
ncbi:hypothetical protein RJ639_043142 [Escallonia herrerae]|uniref:FBD domain-containing protein n=1 Tax=Escallonia herrerae TaxID=1293975 RepID=A0AA88WF30_9ASTE|nr:hypothetical protein RJ639_043142 [Escallonia herrerae]